MRWPILVVMLAFINMPLRAQTAADLGKAAEVVTPQGITKHISAITSDSMMRRSTPSQGLDRTAQYVANEFMALGLKPGGQDGAFIERYPIPLPLDPTRSRLALAANGKEISLNFATAALRLGTATMPAEPVKGAVMLVAGKQTIKSIEKAGMVTRNKTVLYVLPSQYDADEQEMLVRQLTSASRGVVILSSQDSASFATDTKHMAPPSNVRLGQRWALYVRSDAVAGLNALLASNGIDLAQIRSDTTPMVRDVPSIQVSLDPQFEKTTNDNVRAPNVVALLEGSDPKLKNEYIVYSAHMDRSVDGRGKSDSLHRGADDNASGVAALLELAKAYSQPGARPKRSLVFVATSGSAEGGWGSNAFADRAASSNQFSRMFGSLGMLSFGGIIAKVSTGDQAKVTGQGDIKFDISSSQLEITSGDTSKVSAKASVHKADSIMPKRDTTSRPKASVTKTVRAGSDRPSVSLGNVIANINLDMIGRGPRDSVTVDGIRDLELPTSPAWIAAAHPELQLAVVDGGTAARPRSDHYSFIRQGIPSLFFHNGLHDDRPTTDLPTAINAEQTARIARLAFYVGHDLMNAAQAPRWTQEGRRNYLTSLRK